MTDKAESQLSDDESALRAAIRSALNGEAILFLGAGAAKAAKTSKGDYLPKGQELSDALATDCGLGGGYPLDSITVSALTENIFAEIASVESSTRRTAQQSAFRACR